MTALLISWWIIGLQFSIAVTLELRESRPAYMQNLTADIIAALAWSLAGPMPYFIWWADQKFRIHSFDVEIKEPQS